MRIRSHAERVETQTAEIDGWSFLDLFSTSQTFEGVPAENVTSCAVPKCIKNPPYFAYQAHDKTYAVVQGCCNSWNCPKCGKQRAKAEYGRIVQGCRTLSEEHDLYFMTITCRGREMTVKEAHDGYLAWTNKLLSCLRVYSSRKNQFWSYASVTEHQKRGHPHSHYLTTFCPPDLLAGTKRKWKTDNSGALVYEDNEALLSDYLERACKRSGLGNQYDISRVASAEAASRYVAKYLFKPTIFTEKWPSGWKRVRYSNNFPRLPEAKTTAWVLLGSEDWRRLARLAVIVRSENDEVKSVVYSNLRGSDCIIQ